MLPRFLLTGGRAARRGVPAGVRFHRVLRRMLPGVRGAGAAGLAPVLAMC